MRILLIIPKISCKTEIKFSRSDPLRVKTTVTLKDFVNDCLLKYFLVFNSPQTTSSWLYLNILLTLKRFTEFWPKIRAINLETKCWHLHYLATGFPLFLVSWNLVWKDYQVCFRTSFWKNYINSIWNVTSFKNWNCSSRHNKQKKILQNVSESILPLLTHPRPFQIQFPWTFWYF